MSSIFTDESIPPEAPESAPESAPEVAPEMGRELPLEVTSPVPSAAAPQIAAQTPAAIRPALDANVQAALYEAQGLENAGRVADALTLLQNVRYALAPDERPVELDQRIAHLQEKIAQPKTGEFFGLPAKP